MRFWITGGFLIIFTFAGINSSQAYEVVTVSDGGAVTGKVFFKGDPPPPQVFTVEKDSDICGNTMELKEVAVNDGHLADVLVLLEDISSGKPFPDGGNEFSGTEVVAKDCRFNPFGQVSFTGVIGRGKPIRFINEDPVGHNPHGYEMVGRVRLTMINRVLEGNGEFKTVAKMKKKKSRVMKLECDQHNFMHNFFYVIKNPYYSITRGDGVFMLDRIPPGNYRLTAWHPKLGTKTQDVIIKAKESVTLTFEFSN